MLKYLSKYKIIYLGMVICALVPQLNAMWRRGNEYRSSGSDFWTLLKEAQAVRHDESINVIQVRIKIRKAIEAARTNFEEAKGYQELGKAYRQDLRKAFECFDKAISLAPDFPDFYFTAGDFAGLTEGNISKGKQYFARGIKECKGKYSDKVLWAYRSLGKLYREVAKDLDGALRQYELGYQYCIEMNHKSIGVFARLKGLIFFMKNETAEAAKFFEEAIVKLDNSNFNDVLEAYEWLGRCLAGHDDDQAQAVFQKGLGILRNRSDQEKDKTRVVVYYHAMAEFYMVFDEIMGLKIYAEGFEICRQIYCYEMCPFCESYAALLEARGDLKSAKRVYKVGYLHAQKRKPELVVDMLDNLIRLYGCLGKPEKMEHYSRQLNRK